MTPKLKFNAVKLNGDRLEFSDQDKRTIRAWVGNLPVPYFGVTFERPFRPRTTGKNSQSHRVNGFIQQIAVATGQDFDDIKLKVKYLAISRGWPFLTVEEVINGVLHEFKLPKSETVASVEDCKALIETVEQYAAENGIRLIEDN